MNYFIKNILTNIWSVIAGVMLAMLIIFPIGLLVAFLSFSDASIPQSRLIFLDVIFISGIFIGCIVAGYTTAKISIQKYMMHGFITGLVLTILYGLSNDFDLNWKNFETGIAYLCFVPVTLMGTALGIKSKNKT